ncbi:MAG: glycine cleavage system protein GcvH [Ignavibacteria bacterium]|nr:glycine cleavage system protein GcvH [Ignavibacteria bacterium]MCA0387367.1 glycine cleavage system protein GcvH [Bacteroidota bacterium]
MNIPSDLKYTKEHEWIRIEGNTGYIGITDYAQGELGDVVFVDITKAEGDSLSVDENFGTIEAVKTVSELYAPCSGKIVEINSSLGDSPENINQDPYDKGWMIKIEIANPAELDALLDAAAYGELVGA